MCGIGGFYNVSGGQTPVAAISSLWEALEVRGTHASGFSVGWKDADLPVTLKRPGRTHKLSSKMEQMTSGLHTQYVLLHTRYATQGDVNQNGNNHPIVEHGFTTTHNGWVNNYHEIVDVLGVEGISPNNQVDSECLNMILKADSIQELADWVDGPVSLAWVDHDKPDTVHLFTNGQNPLVIARTKSGDIVWSSTLAILENSDFVIDKFFHATPFKQYTLTPDGKITSHYVSEQRDDPHWGTVRAAKGGWSWDNLPKTYRTSQNGSKGAKKAKKPKAVYSQNRGWVWE